MMSRTKKDFYKEFIRLAVPIVGLEVLSTSVNLLSSLMVGQLGEQAIVSVGFCNQFFQMFTMIIFGITNGTAIFTSQYWGKKDFSGIRQMVMLSLLLTEILAVIFFLTCQLRPWWILGVFTENPEILEIGCKYIKIVSWNYLLSTYLMILLMISVIFETCNHIGLVGVLKSGGDSFFNFVVDTIGVWGISLPLLFLTGIVLHLNIEIVYGMSLIEIVIKSFVVRHRIRKCQWARNLVGNQKEEEESE